MIKWSILQEDITILKVYVPNNRTSYCVRQKLTELQRQIDESTIIVGYFNTPLSEWDRSSRQKISKDIVQFNSTINQLSIIDIYKLLHPTKAKYTFFSGSHGTFTDIDHLLSHITSSSKFKTKYKKEIIQCLFSDYNEIKLQIYNRNRTGTFQHRQRLNNNNPWAWV